MRMRARAGQAQEANMLYGTVMCRLHASAQWHFMYVCLYVTWGAVQTCTSTKACCLQRGVLQVMFCLLLTVAVGTDTPCLPGMRHCPILQGLWMSEVIVHDHPRA
jgi:hypothetical protein